MLSSDLNICSLKLSELLLYHLSAGKKNHSESDYKSGQFKNK